MSKVIELKRKEKLSFWQQAARAGRWLVHVSFVAGLVFVGAELRALRRIVGANYFETVGISNFNERNRPVWEALRAEGFECSIDKKQFAKLEK